MEVKTETKQHEHPEPGPLAPDQIFGTALMFAVACIGGAVSFYRKVREEKARPFNLTELVGELFVSGVCGVFAFWVLKGLHVDPYLTAAGVGIVGHMGSRAIFLAETFIEALFRKWQEDPEKTKPGIK
jgi:hypothetical protein